VVSIDLLHHLLAPLNRSMNVAVTGRVDADPPWLQALSEGDDVGYFGPGSAVWTVHGRKATVVAALRALLLQVAHPAVAAGVVQHSAYQTDPHGRLLRTVEWLAVTTYGSRAQADAASTAIRRRHLPVTGTVAGPDGQPAFYDAREQDLLRWVHNSLTDSILTCHQTWESTRPVLADEYVREWAAAGVMLGLEGPPTTMNELRGQIEQERSTLRSTDEGRAVIDALRHPPLGSAAARDVYSILLAGAESTLPAWVCELHGLQPSPPALTGPAVTALVHAMDIAVGDRGPARRRADERLQRLGIPSG
jgi:uncharacterized protein (DUF2236 family)